MRVKATRCIQQLASGHPSQPLSREDQGDLLAGGGELLERSKRLARGSQADYAVVPRVAVGQLLHYVLQGPRVLVNGEKHGARGMFTFHGKQLL